MKEPIQLLNIGRGSRNRVIDCTYYRMLPEFFAYSKVTSPVKGCFRTPKRVITSTLPSETFSRDPSKNLQFNSPANFLHLLKFPQPLWKSEIRRNTRRSFTKQLVSNKEPQFGLYKENVDITTKKLKKADDLFKNCSTFAHSKLLLPSPIPEPKLRLGIAGRVVSMERKEHCKMKVNKKRSCSGLNMFQNIKIKQLNI